MSRKMTLKLTATSDTNGSVIHDSKIVCLQDEHVHRRVIFLSGSNAGRNGWIASNTSNGVFSLREYPFDPIKIGDEFIIEYPGVTPDPAMCFDLRASEPMMIKCSCGKFELERGTIRYLKDALNHSDVRCAVDCACGKIADLGFAVKMVTGTVHTVAKCTYIGESPLNTCVTGSAIDTE